MSQEQIMSGKWMSLPLTSLPLAKANPPPRRSMIPHGNFFWATFQVRRRGVELDWWGTIIPKKKTEFISSLFKLGIFLTCSSPVLKLRDFQQQILGGSEGRTKRRTATKIATVASVTYLMGRTKALFRDYCKKMWRLEKSNKSEHKLCFGVEDVCCPACYKTWISCEPQDNKQREKSQDANLSKGHGPQQTKLIPKEVIDGNVLLCLHAAATPRLLEAKWTKTTSNCCCTFKQIWASAFLLNPEQQLDSLESHVYKLEPKPGQSEHEDHVWEGEAKPGGKVNDILVFRKQSRKDNICN